MAGGDGFTSAQRRDIDKAIRDAETLCRLEFSVYVGRSEGESHPFARRLHAALVAPDRSVLVMHLERCPRPRPGVLERLQAAQVDRLCELGRVARFGCDLDGGRDPGFDRRRA